MVKSGVKGQSRLGPVKTMPTETVWNSFCENGGRSLPTPGSNPQWDSSGVGHSPTFDLRSLVLGAPPPRPPVGHHIQKRAERSIHCRGVRKGCGNIGVKHHHVRSCPVSGHVLTPHPTPKVIVRPHGVSIGWPSTGLLHTFVSPGDLLAAH